jgi:predicted nucleotidyltransferase
MKNMERLNLAKFSPEAKEPLFKEVLSFIETKTPVREIIFFGSIVTEGFDAWSDIDSVAIYDTHEAADLARRTLYSLKRPDLGHSLEILCVDRKTFEEKAQIGGVYALAKSEGRSFKITDPPTVSSTPGI